MLNLYKKYYLEEDAIKQLLQDATIVFDTSALLDLYYYSEETREEIFEKVFAYLKDRLWIPAQVYFEYLKNKTLVSNKPINSYRNLISKSDKVKDGGYVDNIVTLAKKIDKDTLQSIRGQLKTLKETTKREDKHPYFDPTIYDEFEEAVSDFEKNVAKFTEQSDKFKIFFKEKVDSRINEFEEAGVDVVYEAVKSHFQIGKELSYSEMMEIAKEGAFRYEEMIPPGYKDGDSKQGLQKYGDLFAWKQILMYAGKGKKDVILVINDVKEDWFEEDKKTPRYELLREFNAIANKSIWLMPMSLFLYQINSFLASGLAENTIDDVETVFESRAIQELQEDDVFDSVQGILSQVFQEDVYLIDNISINNMIRIFDKPILYEAEDEEGGKYRIIVTVIGSGAYAKTLHAMTNAFEIKKFYDRNGEHYRYYNFVILKNKGVAEKFDEHLFKKKVKNLFNRREIQTIVCQYDAGEIGAIKTNFSNG